MTSVDKKLRYILLNECDLRLRILVTTKFFKFLFNRYKHQYIWRGTGWAYCHTSLVMADGNIDAIEGKYYYFKNCQFYDESGCMHGVEKYDFRKWFVEALEKEVETEF